MISKKPKLIIDHGHYSLEQELDRYSIEFPDGGEIRLSDLLLKVRQLIEEQETEE